MRPEDTEKNTSRCLCPGCPTYNDCMRDASQWLFCSRGETECLPHARGCICGECPVWEEYDLASTYYCLEGAAD